MKRLCAALTIVASCCGCAPSHTGRADLNAVAWMQTSEEYPALALGTYAMARRSLDDALADRTWTALPSHSPTSDEQAGALITLPPAVIVDIDETVLSTLPYQAWLVKNNKALTHESWNAWVSEASAESIPGALDFVRYARKKGVRVFYISNRSYRGPLDRNANGRLDPGEDQVDLEPYTIANLVRLGFLPQQGVSNEDAVLLQGETREDGRLIPGWDSWDKTARRRSLSSNYRILLIIGDDLNDFTPYQDHRRGKANAASNAQPHIRGETLKAPDRYRTRWGHSWFMLPNPVYGSWERRQNNSTSTGSDHERIETQMNWLDPWRRPAGKARE